MKNLFISLSFVALSLFSVKAQNPESSKPFIEVTGSSEMEVIPDEIYINITLMERMDGKEKITIDKPEADLKKNLKELGIDLANLSLNSANADYGKVRKSEKDVLVNKSYSLKVGGTDLLAKVYERLDKINAYDAYISRYTHSKILDLQKENRIKAIKAAKEKVDYLLAALSQQAGKTLQINEMDNYVDQAQLMPRAMNAKSMQMMSNERASEESGAEMAFKKIKIRSSFLVKYEILNK
jgi:uncharacterized protein YggE